MRVGVRCVLAAVVIAASVVAGPAGTSTAASQSSQPLVLTFVGPVADRRAAEHALNIKSVPPMTGTFEWVENNVVQWVPDQFWPAHSTVSLSVRNMPLTNFQTGPAVVGIA